MPDPTLSPPDATNEPQDFTTSLKAIEGILDRYKSGTLSLEESLNLFETGVKHLKICQTQLATAKGKVEELVKGLQEDGEAVTRPFEEGK